MDGKRQIGSWNGDWSGPGIGSSIGVLEFSQSISVALGMLGVSMGIVLTLLLLEGTEMMLYAVGNIRGVGIAELDSGVLEGVGVVLGKRGVVVVGVSERVGLVGLQIERK